MNIPNRVMIIPDIDSVNWGRKVGYTPRMIDVDLSVKAISGTKIRKMIEKKDSSWKTFLCPGVAEIILENN
jgi:predicted nucleotidyltransferase